MFQLKTPGKILLFVVAFTIISVVPGLRLAFAQAAPPAAVEADLFTRCWEYKSTPDLAIGVAANESSFYFLDTDGKLEAVDLALATKRWSTEIGGEVISNLLVGANAVFVATVTPSSQDAKTRKVFLRSLSQQTGITNWNREITSSSRVYLGILNGNIISVGADGNIAGNSVGDGSQIWTRPLDSSVTTDPYFGVTELVVGTAKKQIVSIAGLDGRTSILSSQKQVPSAVLVGPRGRHLVGDDRGNLVFISPSGPRWKFKNGAEISSVMSYDSEYLASSFDNFIYKLSRGGNVEWKRRLSGRVANRPLIIKDAAIVSTVGDGSVYIIDLKNGKVLNRLETGDESTAGLVRTALDGGFIISTGSGFSFFSPEKCPPK